ncbi:MAG: single-stranded DNA-binding protein [Oscillospiraceae bacterium]|nr:single-stranded DNA-binding protein [Oscillospiraceae bacterium]
MNKVILMGRLTRDPEIRYTQGENSTCVARYSLAVDRRFKRDGDQQADFPNCVAFGKTAEFAEKYLQKGTKICIVGRLTTGSYTNKEGNKVYTTEVTVEEHYFAESKNSGQNGGGGYSGGGNSGGGQQQRGNAPQTDADGFMNIPDGMDDELPWH